MAFHDIFKIFCSRYKWHRENSTVPPEVYQILTEKTYISAKLFSSTGFSLPVEELEAAGQ